MVRKHIKIVIPALILMLVFSITIFKVLNSKSYIDKILDSKSYSYLPKEAKQYIKEVYELSGEVLPTEKNKEENQPYLNPRYAEYLALSESKKNEVEEIPEETIVDYEILDEGSEDIPVDVKENNGNEIINMEQNNVDGFSTNQNFNDISQVNNKFSDDNFNNNTQ